MVTIDFRNGGGAAAVFQVRSADNAQGPRSYTVEPGRQLTDGWEITSDYDLSVHGPNGFFRRFKGNANTPLEVNAAYDERARKISLEIRNLSTKRTRVRLREGYTSRETSLSLNPGETAVRNWWLSRSHGWYDLTITVQDDPDLEYRYAGHLENGEDSISDPLMGGLL